jgi:hypothetical protein
MGRRMTWMYEYAVSELNDKGKPTQKMVLSEKVPEGIEKERLRKVRVAVYHFG